MERILSVCVCVCGRQFDPFKFKSDFGENFFYMGVFSECACSSVCVCVYVYGACIV